MSNLNNFLNIGANTGNFIGNITTTGNITASGNLSANNITGNLITNITTIGNITATGTIGSNLAVLVGDALNNTSAKLRLTTTSSNTFIQAGNGVLGSTGNVIFATFLSQSPRVVIDIGTGNITASGNINATRNITGNTVTSRGEIYGVNNLVIGSNAAEGGQLTLGWANVGAITGQVNGTWQIDVDAGNALRAFYQNSNGGIREMMRIDSTANTVSLPGGNLTVAGTISDSLGPVRSMLSGQFVVGFGEYIALQGATVDVGPQGIVLPAAGTYAITYTCRTYSVLTGGYGVVILTDVLNNKLDFSEVITALGPGVQGVQTTVTSTYIVTISGPTTYKMRLNAKLGEMRAFSDNNGVSRVAWVQIST